MAEFMTRRLLCSALVWFLAAIGVAAIEVIEHETRWYFGDLSDSEYDSIRPGPAFLPYVWPCWETGPINSQGYFGMSSPQHAKDADIDAVAQLLATTGNPYVVGRFCQRVATGANPRIIPTLKAALTRVPDAPAKIDLLQALDRLQVDDAAELVAPYLAGADFELRRMACTVYARQRNCDPALLAARLESETHPLMILTIRRALLEIAAQTELTLWLPLRYEEGAEAVATALVATVDRIQTAAERQALIDVAASDDITLRSMLADALGAASDEQLLIAVLPTLSTDAHAGVRLAAAAAIGRAPLAQLQPQLLKLAADERAAVRRAAAESMRQYANEAGFLQLVELNGDTSPLVRCSAHESLRAIVDKFPVDARLGEWIGDENEDRRLCVARVLGEIGSNRHVQALHAQLANETRATNIAANIRALKIGEAHFAVDDILARASHPDPDVRAAVAETIGELLVERGAEIIIDYSLNDHAAAPRMPAVIAMGLLRDAKFEATLLTILKRTNYAGPEFLTGADRCAACWSLAQLPALGDKTRRRLYDQVTKEVIATPLGPTYDNSEVRASAVWTMASHAKQHRDQELSALVWELKGILDRPEDERGTPQKIATDYRLGYYTYQAVQFIEDQPIEKRTVRLRKYRFDYRYAKKVEN